MSLTLKNGSTDISSAVKWGELDCLSVLTKERGSLKFKVNLNPSNAALLPAVADSITLADASGTIFGGTVTGIQTTVRGGVLLQALVTVSDYGFALDSKLVKKSYTDMDPADIVADLVTTYGPSGYDTTTHVQRGGFTIKSISFNYEQLTKCIESLARQIGWDWYIDASKNLHFFFATTDTGSSEYNPAPIVIDDTSGGLNWQTLDVDVNITNLKNSIYVIGGTYTKEYTSSTAIDVYTTVSGTTVYPLAYRYSGSFYVTLDGVVQSQGIDQKDDPSLFDVMYNGNGPFIRFTSDPGAGHTLKVYGLAQIPIVAYRSDSASILTYGEYQDSIIDPQISTVEEAQARAIADITMYGHPVYDVKFSTLETGLRVGQVILLNSTKFGVSNYPLVIKRIEATGYGPDRLMYQVEAIGSDTVTFTDTMLFLLQQQNANVSVDPSTVIQIFLTGAKEALTIGDTLTATGFTSQSKWGPSSANSKWGFCTWR